MQAEFVQSYEVLTREGVSHGELGAQALQRAALRLKKSLRGLSGSPGEASQEQLLEALQWNQRLWTILQIELASANCSLEGGLRSNLLRLSRYVDSLTFQCLAEADSAKVEGLVRINESLADGLFSSTAAGELTPAAAAPVAVSLSF